jgi:hypothetical protein
MARADQGAASPRPGSGITPGGPALSSAIGARQNVSPFPLGCQWATLWG